MDRWLLRSHNSSRLPVGFGSGGVVSEDEALPPPGNKAQPGAGVTSLPQPSSWTLSAKPGIWVHTALPSPGSCFPGPPACPPRPSRPTHPAQLVVGKRAGIHERLRDDQEHGVHVIRRLHVEHKLWVFYDVDPESQGQAAGGAGMAGEHSGEAGEKTPARLAHPAPATATPPHLLVFQMWTVSWSEMPCCWACSSSRSKKYLIASGTGRLVLRITWKRSSTNFCRVPCGGGEAQEEGTSASARPRTPRGTMLM